MSRITHGLRLATNPRVKFSRGDKEARICLREQHWRTMAMWTRSMILKNTFSFRNGTTSNGKSSPPPFILVSFCVFIHYDLSLCTIPLFIPSHSPIPNPSPTLHPFPPIKSVTWSLTGPHSSSFSSTLRYIELKLPNKSKFSNYFDGSVKEVERSTPSFCVTGVQRSKNKPQESTSSMESTVKTQCHR